MTNTEQEKYAISNQMERVPTVRKFLGSRERINSCPRTSKEIQGIRETKDKHSSIAGAIEP